MFYYGQVLLFNFLLRYCLDLRLFCIFHYDLVKGRVGDMHHVLWCHLVVSYEAHLVHPQQFYSIY